MKAVNGYSEYDLEPVKYCSNCYSLKIKYEEIIDAECCGECGCSDIVTSSISEWEEKYEKRYGHKFTCKSGNPQKHPIYKLPIRELKKRVFQSSLWQNICRKLYPKFPVRLNRADGVMWLFDRLIKDNRINDLKLLLIKIFKEKDYGREESKQSKRSSNEHK